MGASINSVVIAGNLGADPELRYTQNNTAVVTMSVATTDKWNDKQTGQPQEKVEWHRIVVFGGQAENHAKFLKKGSGVLVEGSIQTKSFEDKATGQKRYSTDIKAFRVHYLDKRDPQQAQPQQAAPQQPQQQQAAPQQPQQQQANPQQPLQYQQPEQRPQGNPYQQPAQPAFQPTPNNQGFQEPPQGNQFPPPGPPPQQPNPALDEIPF